MKNNILRIDAVNLANIIGDTEDISVRRGGSYMLLQAIRDIEDTFADDIEPISTGASVGLFHLKKQEPDDLRGRLLQFLQSHKNYRHATFMVDIVSDDQFHRGVERAVAANRWQQMSSLSFATGWGGETLLPAPSNPICGIDRVRPAVTERKYKRRVTCMSQASKDRADFGRDLRQAFYRIELGKYAETIGQAGIERFTDNLEQLSSFDESANSYKKLPSALNRKVAVFYADGNAFGKIQQRCSSASALRQWDDFIKNKRSELLAELLKFMISTPWGKSDSQAIRIQTLLWGGDELLFVVPAWLGIEFAERFFEITSKWTYSDEPLTHAAGLVFARHNAPISQLQSLAKKLADQGKQHRPLQNSVAWLVLESFDHAGTDLENYWRRNGVEHGWPSMLLEPDKLREMRQLLTDLKPDLPLSAMVRVLRSVAKRRTEVDFELLCRSYQSVNESQGNNPPAFAKLWRTLSGGCEWNPLPANHEDIASHAAAWSILLELWNYLLSDALNAEATAA